MEELIRSMDRGLKNSCFLRRQFVKVDAALPDTKKRVTRLYRGNCFFALFVFSSSGTAPGVKNLLECRILTHKDALLFFPLSRLAGLLEDCYRFCDYPFIATPCQMEQALAELLEILESLCPKITDFFCNHEKKTAFFEELIEELNSDCGERLFFCQNGHCIPNDEYDPLYISKMLSIWYGMRLSSRLTKPFCFFFEDRPITALEGVALYAARDGELRRLINLPLERIHFSPLQKQLYLLSRRPNRLTVLPMILLSMIGCSLLLGPLLAGLCYLIYQWGAGAFSGELLYHTSLGGAQYAFAVFPAILAGLLWLCFDTTPLYRLIYGKKLYKAYVRALAAPLERRLTRLLGCVLLSALLVFTFLQGHHGVAFKEERFTDCTDYFSLEGRHYVYGDLLEAAHVKSRPMAGSEQNINYSSVILLLEDGTVIDLYHFCTERQTTEQILPLLLNKQVPVVEYDSLDDFYKIHPEKKG